MDFKQQFFAPEVRKRLTPELADNISAETMQDCSDNG